MWFLIGGWVPELISYRHLHISLPYSTLGALKFSLDDCHTQEKMKTKVMQNFGWKTRHQLWEMCKWIYPALVIAVAKVSQLNILHAKQLSGLSRNKKPLWTALRERRKRRTSKQATFSCKFGEVQLTSREQGCDCFLQRQGWKVSFGATKVKNLCWCCQLK